MSMKLKFVLKYMFYLFCVIVTAQVIYILVLAEIRDIHTAIDYRALQTFVLTAFAGVLPVLIFNLFDWPERASRRAYFLLLGLHFILTISFVFGTLYFRGMIATGNLISAIILFSVIYLGVSIRNEIRARKTTAELNKRINATHQQ